MIQKHPRRRVLQLGLAAATLALGAPALAATRIRWDDLIPPGVAYGEIIGLGSQDFERDVWLPEFDENGLALNMALDGTDVTIAGFMIPLDLLAGGVTDFVLVPFVGACIHVPPPPPNQLIFVTAQRPWPRSNLWEALLVTGRLRANLHTTQIAQTGYELDAVQIEPFVR
ncbi:DUF3299 domain-containing protein [Pseudorhodobacter sp. MZDSW-24AT]|uniref:DUF3299 domain-containing protein n=1 Tax=Pseudorhodobacter sp. MZDSW-24AT TaxID=2052957 RepID=UPI001E5ECEEC|nr:DUF3299 domain-containing protein [Pseudorhodobacter sp. MZDSW-24AT]